MYGLPHTRKTKYQSSLKFMGETAKILKHQINFYLMDKTLLKEEIEHLPL